MQGLGHAAGEVAVEAADDVDDGGKRLARLQIEMDDDGLRRFTGCGPGIGRRMGIGCDRSVEPRFPCTSIVQWSA